MYQIQKVSDLKWSSGDKVGFSCIVKFSGFATAIPVGVDPTDEYPHIKELWETGTATTGNYGPIADYEKQPDEFPVEITTGGTSNNTETTFGTQPL